ncbi:hypothetical protein JB92DRAFT_2824405 [Gautieria morchelliformis]|nr:hypothetical protein JB92DRAFT_2824405 [Gautieria morchelliformis]
MRVLAIPGISLMTVTDSLWQNITLDARSRAVILVPIDDTDDADEAELQQLLIQVRISLIPLLFNRYQRMGSFGEGSSSVPNFEQGTWYCPVILVHRPPLHLNGFLTATEGVFLWDYISIHNGLIMHS